LATILFYIYSNDFELKIYLCSRTCMFMDNVGWLSSWNNGSGESTLCFITRAGLKYSW